MKESWSVAAVPFMAFVFVASANLLESLIIKRRNTTKSWAYLSEYIIYHSRFNLTLTAALLNVLSFALSVCVCAIWDAMRR